MADGQVPRNRAYYKSPEYKRLCRERRCLGEGREWRPSGPGGKGRAAGYARTKAVDPAAAARAAWREWIDVRAPIWWLARYETVRYQCYLAGKRAYAKTTYDADPGAGRAKVRSYKDRNPERVADWHKSRQARMVQHGVEAISNSAMGQLFERAACPYCNVDLAIAGRELDHIIPLARGGRHELRNLVACCPACNRRKAARPFSEWTKMLAPEQRTVATRMFRRRFGAIRQAEQVALEG